MADTFAYRFVYAHVLYSLVNFAVPYVFLSVFSFLLIDAYRTQRRRHQAMKTPPKSAVVAIPPGANELQPLHHPPAAAAAAATDDAKTTLQNNVDVDEVTRSKPGKKPPSPKHADRNEHSTTLVVVAVVAAFGLCNLPAKIVQLVAYGKAWRTQCDHPAYFILRLANALELASSICNFIVYCALRRQFRAALRTSVSASRRTSAGGQMAITGGGGTTMNRVTTTPLQNRRLLPVAHGCPINKVAADSASSRQLLLVPPTTTNSSTLSTSCTLSDTRGNNSGVSLIH